MNIFRATHKEICDALDIVNKRYDNNIIFRRFESKGKMFIVLLKAVSVQKAGHRLGFHYNCDGTRRKLALACWHVHGDFFDALFNINPNIYVRVSTHKITVNEGNWYDRNVGSVVDPMKFSEACECAC
jgi:hypothetical protein